MQISINDLESLIDPTILQRGKDYFRRGLVAELEEVEEDRWSALVEGTQTYEVRVKLKGDRIAESLCDCPYDFGPVCKHEVAVYLAIGKILAGEDLPEKKKKPSQRQAKRKTVADKIIGIVKKLTEEEMREIILEYALNDREFRNTLLARNLLKKGEAGENKKEDYKRIMRDSLRLGMDRHGFIGYWSSSRAIRGIEELVYEADKMLEQQKPERALPIYQAAIEETVPALQYADDSNGDLGGVIELSFEKLNECAEDIADKNVRKDLFEYALKAAKDKIYDGWSDWQWEWLGIASKLIGNLEEKKKLLQKIDELAAASQIEDSYSSKYDRERAAELKLEILKKWDQEKVSQFIADNLEHTPIRRIALEDAIVQKDYKKAKELAKAGMELDAKRGYPGLVHEWLNSLLRIAELENDAEAVRKYSKELFFKGHHEFKYYDKLKSTYSQEEWLGVADRLIKELIESRNCDTYIMGEIFIREEKWPELLGLMKSNPSEHTLDSFGKYLEDRFPDDLIEIHELVIRDILKRTSGRAVYQNACRRLRRMKKMGAGERVLKMVEEFRRTYKNRRALLEELEEF
ncbi:MAG: hypothetical protein COW32_08215 [Candidatus Aquicultor secundus]|uniref:SWIM-type domain-containing protein n=1 Tax=Candidatus Aquicultor secundus TaxID=1973895 RepID=A0A2M7T8A3_9ACTN|nr:MAG: hypothetical protein AUK32_00665 [Candidatus Aquicultor secundus]PIU26845.1 MAG: hypothetical protein COT10_06545 [Candidatus Aquicultor secundus]PIW21752.1 MAG: hypothetical protein COW32_08215 [Candidatus Aquicultor secundus]PIX52169.1 MAG: hypothetical protein COZ51_05825 [Candidatus Aquicultor secundus]PIY38296.1 MAG: hypothetical protein COZ03_08485 [Candidatus Aquicultor secundus]